MRSPALFKFGFRKPNLLLPVAIELSKSSTSNTRFTSTIYLVLLVVVILDLLTLLSRRAGARNAAFLRTFRVWIGEF